MQTDVNRLALRAAEDQQFREQFIKEHEALILRTASVQTHRYLTKSDDEWSIALYAFWRAIDVYQADRGDFLPFAQMLIKRSLVDYYRSQPDKITEVPVSPQVLDGSADPEEDTEHVTLALIRNSREASDHSLRDEILAANEMLEEYGFRFYDLTDCSPKQERSRRDCAAAVRYVLARRELLTKLRESHRLPIQEIVGGAGVSRKALDRYRKYLIMAILILSEDFPQLAEYLKYIKGDDAA
ncbi:MAG: hypothetical protein K6C08_00370 [Oscillospiraceae bacterium]|nr:hypothetical protein [Oscillospiraceae bacterium]